MPSYPDDSDEEREQRLLLLLQQNPQGVSDAKLQSEFGSDYALLIVVLQRCLNENRVTVFNTSSGLLYRPVDEDVRLAQKEAFDGLERADVLVYQVIKNSGSAGIWTQDLKNRTGLEQLIMNKCLKKLEQKQLIKKFSSITGPKKKMYILYDLELSKDLIGGPWYTDQEIDTALVETTALVVSKFLREARGGMTLSKLTTELNDKHICNVRLGEDDINQLLNMMRYDGLVEEVDDPKSLDGTGTVWCGTQPIEVPHMIESLPCSQCPNFSECGSTHRVNPANCEYFDKWLQFSPVGSPAAEVLSDGDFVTIKKWPQM